GVVGRKLPGQGWSGYGNRPPANRPPATRSIPAMIRKLLTALAALAALSVGTALCRADTLYVATFNNNSITQVDELGNRTTFAATEMTGPAGIAFDGAGNVYVANQLNNTIHRFSPTGADLGTFASANLSTPRGLAFDTSGNLYAANGDNNT